MSRLDTSMTLLPYFATKDTAIKFIHYLNSRHDNIQFTIDFENNQQIPFLDVSIERIDNNPFSTSIYRKKTFIGLYTKWDSFTRRKYKINLIRTLTYRCLRICSSSSLLQSALNDLKDLLSPPGCFYLQHERCCEQKPKQAWSSHYYGTQKRCFHRFALSGSSE